MNDFTEQFLIEARELTEQASGDLLALEARVDDRTLLESAFRAFHTLKGAAGIMEYVAMERLLHRAEDVLQNLRSGHQRVDAHLVDNLLAVIGQLFRWYEVLARTGEMPGDADASASRIHALFEQSAQPPLSTLETTGNANWLEELLAWANVEAGADITMARAALRFVVAKDAYFRGLDPLASLEAAAGLICLRLRSERPLPAAEDRDAYEANLTIEALFSGPADKVVASLGASMIAEAGDLEWRDLAPGYETSALATTGEHVLAEPARAILMEQLEFLRADLNPSQARGRMGSAVRAAANILAACGLDGAAIELAGRSGERHDLISAIESVLGFARVVMDVQEASPTPVEPVSTTIRVDIALVDEIVMLAGEILIVRDALAHLAKLAAEGADAQTLEAGLRNQHERLGRHLSDLQRSALDLRVLPLDRVFGRFPRLVRETAGQLGKQVNLVMEGEDTRADKAVVEALFEPLLHVVRNALDHGIEMPDDRRGAGKPDAARLTLRGFRESDSVIVEIEDDGRGIDPQRIRRLAIERGVVDAPAGEAMSDDQIVDLVFAPGFSTASAVTDLSGRGVGMSAVRAGVASVGGSVSLRNRPGRGLIVRLILPFTITVTKVMTVEAGGQTFGIPFEAIAETVRVPRSAILPVGHSEAVVLRNRTVPVIDLAGRLGLPSLRDNTACLLVVQANGLEAALEITRPGERLDMMMTRPEGILAAFPAISATSLMGDGRVLIILDVATVLS